MRRLLWETVALCLCALAWTKQCTWQKRIDAPEVYWINMDRSVTRKRNMERHLNEVGFRHFRVRGLTPKEIYIPDDVERTWRTAGCLLESAWKPPLNASTTMPQYTSYTATLCGRGKKKNTPKELGCTTSHLMAMHRAVYSPTATSRYALVVEDDVQFPFDIDYNALAATAPKGFGILQLFNSNKGSMQRTFVDYKRNPSPAALWVPRNKFDYWSTCGYLIDRVAIKPIIDAVLRQHHGMWEFRIVAGITSPCVPRACCGNTTNTFIEVAPCVLAAQGYQADSFLYAMANTQVMTIPVIANGLGGNQSTFHQDHVEMLHKQAFRQQREFINELLQGSTTAPTFLKPACGDQLLDVNLI